MTPLTRTFSLGSLFGIPLYVDASFFFVAALVALGPGDFMAGLFVAAGLGASILAHEFGHSLTARRYGFATRRITLSALGGCAEIEGIPSVPSHEALVALAGPAVSFALAVLFFGLSFALAPLKHLLTASIWLCLTNAVLCAFNLLPGFPMDGGRVLRAWLSRKRSRVDATRTAMNVGRVFAVLLACWGAFNVMSGNLGGATSLLISWFIWRAGWAEYEAVLRGG